MYSLRSDRGNGDQIQFEDFNRVFVDKGKSMIVDQATPGARQNWNTKRKQGVYFAKNNKSAPAVNLKSSTKSYNPILTIDEELYAFKKYLVRYLQLEQRVEDVKIKFISNELFQSALSVFEVLAKDSSEITANSLHEIVRIKSPNLTMQDCETLLYTIQYPMNFEKFRQLLLPISEDFK